MNIEQARYNMVEQQLRTWQVLDEKVLDVFRVMPRETLVPSGYHDLAYADFSIPLPEGRALLKPKEEARFLQVLDVKDTDKALELGTSATLTTLLAYLAASVKTFDVSAELQTIARAALYNLGHQSQVQFFVESPLQSFVKFAPFDVVIVTGSLPAIPQSLLDVLAVGGRLIAVVGNAPAMQAVLVKRIAQAEFSREVLFETVIPRLPGLGQEVPVFSF